MMLALCLSAITIILAGLPGSLFVAVQSGKELRKNTKRPPNDLIVFSISVSSLLLQLVELVMFISNVLQWFCYFTTGFLLLTLEAFACCFWFTAWLCVFYCVKIVSANWRVIALAKVKFPTIVPQLILGTIIATLVITCATVTDRVHRVSLKNASGNYCTLQLDDFILKPIYYVLYPLLGCVVPLILMTISSGFLVHSLCCHRKKMKTGTIGFTKPCTKTYGHVIKMIVGSEKIACAERKLEKAEFIVILSGTENDISENWIIVLNKVG
ncbi:taste receptor type 2 member 4-like [Protopterus annectens]|uniref:taste receptor type 2 member 4-like n=1 Tax=Protopterus annectens TaxID=7888 RepID=UPI001CF9379A|nr:taste receptor type 2 member 4-like [Protopterus annectens]